jgi:hypothetical protein
MGVGFGLYIPWWIKKRSQKRVENGVNDVVMLVTTRPEPIRLRNSFCGLLVHGLQSIETSHFQLSVLPICSSVSDVMRRLHIEVKLIG